MAVPRGPPAQHMRRCVESCQKKLRQLGDIHGDPSRFIFAEQLGR